MSSSSMIASVSSSNNMDPPTARNTTNDTGHQTVVIQDDDHLHLDVDLPYVLSNISGNKNHQDIARIIGSMTGSGKDKPPVVFVVVDDSKSNNGNNAATMNDQDYLPIRRSNQQRPSDHHHGRAHRGVEGQTGVYRSEANRGWINKNSIAHHDMSYISPFAKPYDDDLEMGTNRGSRDSAGRRSAPTANPMRDDEITDEDYYYYYYKNKYDMSNANRRSMRDHEAYYDIKKSKARHPSEDPTYEKHLGNSRQYWRDIILGVNDGLVSTFLLIAGVMGANKLNATEILLTALAGTIAGAISMAAGEFVATKTQNEVFQGEMALEKRHIAQNRDYELEELKEVFGNIGISADDDRSEVSALREHLLSFYRENDDAHLQCHTALEMGVLDGERRSEYIAGGVAFFLFLFGAMPSVIPFLATGDKQSAFIASGVLTTIGLLFVGGVKTWATRGNWVTSALENLAIAVGGGAIAYGIGAGFEILVDK